MGNGTKDDIDDGIKVGNIQTLGMSDNMTW